jgi:hypothetical protein
MLKESSNPHGNYYVFFEFTVSMGSDNPHGYWPVFSKPIYIITKALAKTTVSPRSTVDPAS